MLRSRTEGNLQPNEKQFLDKVISELQLNYIDEMSKEIKEKEEEKETEKSEKQEKIQEKKKSSKKPVEKVTSGKSQGKKPRGDLKRGTKK
jgi:DNA replication initiation complex subunit (GINS family)